MKVRQYNVLGMHCAGCSSRVEKKVRKLQGVATASVNLAGHCLTVEFAEGQDDAAVISAVNALGFQCSAWPVEPAAEKAQEDDAAAMLRRLLPSAVLWALIAALMFFRMATGADAIWIGLVQLLMTLGVFAINRKVFCNGFKRLFVGADMDSLVALGCSASFLLSLYTMWQLSRGVGGGHFYFESAAMILAIVSFGKWLEAKAKGRAGAALEKLRRLAPSSVTVVQDGGIIERAASSVIAGEVVQVLPGSRIPFDGIVLNGNSAVDVSALTGESVPVDIGEGAQVFAGTMNLSGCFQFRVLKSGQDTLLGEIIRLVAQSAVGKSRAVRLADALAARFVPIIAGIAILSALVWWVLGENLAIALARGISVLVVSCPCALGLATPVAVTVALSRAASAGVLFKSGDALDWLGKVECLFLDKTGTVTTGKMKVTNVLGAGVLEIAAALESRSEHPIAKAICEECARRKLECAAAEGFVNSPGLGVSGTVGGVAYKVGKRDFIGCGQLPSEYTALEESGDTLVYVASEGRMLGCVALGDEIAPGNFEAISRLKNLGLKIAMLTGDNQRTAKAVADKVGIDEVYANLLPGDKAAVIREAMRQDRVVAMVGDGINDAPALAAANVGIALGSGTDIAMDSAGIVILNSQLDSVCAAIHAAINCRRRVRQNLAWAFLYNVLAIPVACGILVKWHIELNPMISALAMSCSSICVVLNSLRMRWRAFR